MWRINVGQAGVVMMLMADAFVANAWIESSFDETYGRTVHGRSMASEPHIRTSAPLF